MSVGRELADLTDAAGDVALTVADVEREELPNTTINIKANAKINTRTKGVREGPEEVFLEAGTVG